MLARSARTRARCGAWALVSSGSPVAAGGVKPIVVVLTHTDSTLTLKNGDPDDGVVKDFSRRTLRDE